MLGEERLDQSRLSPGAQDQYCSLDHVGREDLLRSTSWQFMQVMFLQLLKELDDYLNQSQGEMYILR